MEVVRPGLRATVRLVAYKQRTTPTLHLHPGMPVDVAIVTGQRTLVDYLVQPFTESFARAFREQ